MIKSLSILILSFSSISALALTQNNTAEHLSSRVHKVNSCKTSKQSEDVKDCKEALKSKNKIVLIGKKHRSDLGVLDQHGRYFYMPHGVAEHNFHPSGEIEILSQNNKDKALIYKLEYSSLDKKDKAFRIVTVRLRNEGLNSYKTCVVSIADSTSLNSSTSIKEIESTLRANSKALISHAAFSSLDCSQPAKVQKQGLQISKN